MATHSTGLPRRRERALSATATLVLHLGVIALLLLLRPPERLVRQEPSLTLFDVPRPPPAPPPPPPVVAPAPARVTPDPGGARDTAAPAPAPRPHPAVRERPETTLLQVATPALPLPAIGSALDLGTPALGLGLGNGTGVGNGTGDGAGRRRRAKLRGAAWLRRPTDDEFRAAWPAAAMARRDSGSAVLSCALAADGRPRTCAVLRETPRDGGFGAAAVALSRTFVIRPVTRGDAALDVPVTVPVFFDYRAPSVGG